MSLLAQLDPASPPPPEAAPSETSAVVAAPALIASLATAHLPAGTELEVELVNGASSKTNALGDRVAIRLAAPIIKDGAVIVAAGALGEVEVIDIAKSGMGGKQGKLIIAARHVDLNGQRVRVRGMSLMASGESQVGMATGALIVPYAAPLVFVIRGGDIEIPAGSRAKVRLAQAYDVPVAGVDNDTSGGTSK
jgi:hypothetical protein